MEGISGRVIYHGKAGGQILRSDAAIGFFGHVDVETAIIKEAGHPLFGESIQGKVLVFPRAKGSTVGSYILYALRKKGIAPAALVLTQCEIIVAVGAIIAEIPTVDQVDISAFHTGDFATIDGGHIRIERKRLR